MPHVTDSLATRRTLPPLWTPDALDARLDAGEAFPIVDDHLCTFAFHAPAIGVRLVHFGVGLPDDLNFELLGEERDWWVLTLELPRGSRLEYKLEVRDSFGTRIVEDPLNSRTASHPFGANSVCEAPGHATPEWSIERDDVPRGSIRDVSLDSVALSRRTTASIYAPAGFQPEPAERYPLVIVHDGPDYLNFAAASTVVDNLVHGGVMPPSVVAFVHPGERLLEFADDARHHAYLVTELLPQLEGQLPTGGEPSKRCLVGASFGAVASLSAAVFSPGTFGRLLLQSGSFAGAGTGCWPRPEPLWRPVKQFVRRFLADPGAVAQRVYVTCGVFESLICENRGLVPALEGTGMDVRFDESLDGHNWESWRDSLGAALPALLTDAAGAD